MGNSNPWDDSEYIPADARELAAAYRAFFAAGKGFPHPGGAGLPERHRSILKSTVRSVVRPTDIAPLIEVADMAFATATQAAAEIGPMRDIKDSAERERIDKALYLCFGAATFGLEWLSELVQLRSETYKECVEALRRADALFRRVEVWAERGWQFDLGGRIEDYAQFVLRVKTELQAVLAKAAEYDAGT